MSLQAMGVVILKHQHTHTHTHSSFQTTWAAGRHVIACDRSQLSAIFAAHAEPAPPSGVTGHRWWHRNRVGVRAHTQAGVSEVHVSRWLMEPEEKHGKSRG